FVAIGHDPRSELFRHEVELDDGGYVLVNAPSTQTKLNGGFAAGDLVDHTYRQAITPAGTGRSAAPAAGRPRSPLARADTACVRRAAPRVTPDRNQEGEP